MVGKSVAVVLFVQLMNLLQLVASRPNVLHDTFDSNLALEKLYMDIDRAFEIYISDGMRCESTAICKNNPSNLILGNLPVCSGVEGMTSQITSSEWLEVIQANHEAMQIYQYYLTHHFDLEASSSLPMNLKRILKAETMLYSAFVGELRTQVSNRTCDALSDILVDGTIPELHSPILEAARSYEFLRQYSALLGCFKDVYQSFITSTNTVTRRC